MYRQCSEDMYSEHKFWLGRLSRRLLKFDSEVNFFSPIQGGGPPGTEPGQCSAKTLQSNSWNSALKEVMTACL
jgi:hypothetical protein